MSDDEIKRRGRPRLAPIEDPFEVYTARSVRFLLDHIEEIESPNRRESLRREFFLLGRYQRCRCGGLNEPDPSASGGAGHPQSSLPVSALILDLLRAHDAMPNDWSAKTEVWLLINGSSRDQIEDMRSRCSSCGRNRRDTPGCPGRTRHGPPSFEFIHTSHVATLPEPADPMPWRGTPWSSIAGWLRGAPWPPIDKQEAA